MKKIAKFEKVSYEQFKKDFIGCHHILEEKEIKDMYDKIKLPRRATKGSAGYDFYIPFLLELPPKTEVQIPTGIKCNIKNGWVLKCYPRSGLGFKFKIRLNNTVGIIDSDYFNNETNEGHIMARIANENIEGKTCTIEPGTGFMQGIFVEFGITEDDDVTEDRNGGFGSTTK